MGGGGHQAQVGSGSARGLALTVTGGRRYPGSGTGSAYSGEVATVSGGRDTESSVAGRESSGVGGIGEEATVVPLWTTANEAATSAATHPTGLERSCLFLMREIGSCCDSVPDFG